MRKVRHWFWHFVAIITTCGIFYPPSDAECEAYKAFMKKHGYTGEDIAP